MKNKVNVTSYKGCRGAWEVSIYVAGRRAFRRKSPFDTKRRSEAWGHELLEEIEHKQLQSDEPTGTPTMKAFVERFMEHQASPTASKRGANTPGSLRDKEMILRRHLVPFMGDVPLSEIDAALVDRYIAQKKREPSRRGTPLTDKTLSNHVAVITKMLRVAQRWGMPVTIPEVGYRVSSRRQEFLTFDEAEAFLVAADSQWSAMLRLAVRTGLRVGELRGLRWVDLDLAQAQLHVRQQLTQDGRFAAPKSKRSRTIHLAWDACEALKRLESRYPLVFCKPPGYTQRGIRSGPAVGGEPWSHKEIGNAVKRTAKRAGITKLVTAHTLRHTFGSHCAMRGVTWKQLQTWMGHSDVRVTIDTYCHVEPGYGHVEIDKISARRAPAFTGELLATKKKSPLSFG